MSKRKNILVLTNIYPADDTAYVSTSVVHYFTKEWVKMGYNVRVIHNNGIYLRIFYWFAAFFRYFISTRSGFIVPIKRFKQDHIFTLDGVSVLRFSIFKWIPHTAFSKKRIKRQIEKVIAYNEKDGFIPDMIISHWVNPQLEMMVELKKIYRVKTCLVVHSDVSNLKRIYPSTYKALIDEVDIWGFRSSLIKNEFEQIYGIQTKSFLCYSGIPKEFITDTAPVKDFSNMSRNFLYVGTLIKRKCPDTLLYALNDLYHHESFHLSFVGCGGELQKLKNITEKLQITSKVIFHGLVKREMVRQYMAEAGCFIMISHHETFGLVYLEAMAAGCITIASSDGAFKDIIKDRVNGFLCNPGDTEDLKRILRYIDSLSIEEKKQISYRAWLTVKDFTDSDLARKYILSVENFETTEK